MKLARMPLFLACLMLLAAGLGYLGRPSAKPRDAQPRYVLDSIVPKQFGDWREMTEGTAQVVNPQAGQLLDKLYSQILTRNYVNSQGYRIMLSLAYGGEQRGNLRAHMPEVCYPAQGFRLNQNFQQPVGTSFGNITARRLDTSLGLRTEPVTYWFTVGDTAIETKWQQRWVEIRLGLTGQVPDGLLFRVSSIDADAPHAYKIHDAFVNDLLGALPEVDRVRLSGLGKKT